MKADLLELLRRLSTADVECVLIGGLAANVHGCTIATFDCDVVVLMSPKNLVKACEALQGTSARFRHKEPPIWFTKEIAESAEWKNLYLETDLGVLDCLGSVKGLGDYEECLKDSQEIEIEDFTVRVLGWRSLIKAKEAVGRPKDLQAVTQLKVANGLE